MLVQSCLFYLFIFLFLFCFYVLCFFVYFCLLKFIKNKNNAYCKEHGLKKSREQGSRKHAHLDEYLGPNSQKLTINLSKT